MTDSQQPRRRNDPSGDRNPQLIRALANENGQWSGAFSELVRVVRQVARDEFEQLEWERDHPSVPEGD